MRPNIRVIAVTAAAAILGVAVGYAVWGWPPNFYRQPSLASLAPGPQTDLIRYGWQLVVETPRHIGKSAADPAHRYSGNDLACTQCHLDAGLKAFAAPLVSTFASYPMMSNDDVLTLAERINGCMTRSMNGSPMPEGGREMEGLIAYMQFLGRDTPVGVRVAGMGLRPLSKPGLAPDRSRGEAVYGVHCAQCHGATGQGEPRTGAVGYAIPPLWGDTSFNAAAGMSKLTTAAAFIHANMPPNTNYREPLLTEQQAWDVARFVTSQPRPARRP
jgi:thiosulfate dehydrogenase